MTDVAMSTAPIPLIAISIVNWNTAASTLRCLQSLQAISYTNYRVVVIDNASQDNSVACIRGAHPELTIVPSRENLGFAAGHELGYRQALDWGATAMWLLNSDTEVDADALTQLVAAWQQHGDAVYGAAPLHKSIDGTLLLNFPAKYLDPTGMPRAFQYDAQIEFTSQWQQRNPMCVGAVAGSCVLLPLSVVRAHGWMDPAWFLYCEEIDYCYRLRRLQVPSFLVPGAQVWHRGGGSHRDSPAVEDCIHYYRSRNEIVLALRHTGRWTAALIAAKKCARGLYAGVRRPQRGQHILRGVRDALNGRMGKTLAPEAGFDNGALAGRNKHAITTLLDWLRRFALRKIRVNHVQLAYNPRHTIFIRHYYLYCVDLFRRRLTVENAPLNVVFGDYAVNFRNGEHQLRIDIQHEHTLVKPGGRDCAGAKVGRVGIAGTAEHYLVRVERYDYLTTLDSVIEYSMANIANLASNGEFENYLRKTVCIAPLLYSFNAGVSKGREGMITLFADVGQPRRAQFLQDAWAAQLALRNVKRVFGLERLRQLYRATRIMVNVHQTDHHHTFEELRVLPALLCGVLVVSEDVPLKQHIPYARFIIWSSFENLVSTTQSVFDNYDQHWRRIFGDPQLAVVLQQMQQDNIDAVDAAVKRMLNVAPA